MTITKENLKIKLAVIFIGVTILTLSLQVLIKNNLRIVLINQAPFLAVETSESIFVTKVVPYKSERSNDAEMEEGKTKLMIRGVDGEKEVEYKITRINGTVMRKDAVAEVISTAPINEVRAVGIKEKKPATGTYRRPYFGVVSSRFGSRWGRQHTGIDYSGEIGDPILAADGGIVSFAGTDGGYGNVVKIDHENGYETWYAHMSEIIAVEGQMVSKSDLIGKVGVSGNVTGPHLHFEVRKDGLPQNPETFVIDNDDN